MKTIGRLILEIILFPIRILFFPFEAAIKALRKPRDDDSPYQFVGAAPLGFFPKLRFWTRRILQWIALIPIRMIQAPFVFVHAVVREGKSDLLFMLPALVTMGFFGFVYYQVFANADAIDNRYRAGAQQAIDRGNLKLAKTYYNRIVSDQRLPDRDQLQWATILSQTGETERAAQILSELAPDDRPGYGPAHRIKALSMAANLDNAKDPLTLRKLRNHLENAQHDSLDIKQAWAVYYLAVDQSEKALGYLQAAAESNPQFLLMIAKIYEQKGLNSQRDRALLDAEIAFRKLVAKDPLDTNSRVTLANVLARLEDFEEAEQILLIGLKLQPDPTIRRSTADFYLMRYDVASRRNRPFSDQFDYLRKALSLDENYGAVYQRLIALCGQSNEETAESITAALMETVTGDKPSAMAHFALSNVLWMDGNRTDAEWHIEQAYQLEPGFALVINNLAWILAHKDDPDLERALELAETVVKQSPNDSRFLDTYATVLFLQKKYEDAITPFEKALPTSQVSKSIHEKLATCYQEIGRPELAELHRKKAQDSR